MAGHRPVPPFDDLTLTPLVEEVAVLVEGVGVVHTYRVSVMIMEPRL